MPKTRSRLLVSVLAAAATLFTLLPVGTDVAGAVAPADAPSGLTPNGENVGGNPQLSWDRVAGAARYRLVIDNDDSFASPITDTITYNSSYSPPALLPVGTLYWRVAGLDTGSGQGPWSTVATFTRFMDAPVALAPANGAAIDYPGTSPTFSWTPTPATKSYVLEVDDAPNFPTPTRIVTRTTSHTPLQLEAPGQTYYWRVRSSSLTNGLGINSDWSDVRSFDLEWAWQDGIRRQAPVPMFPTVDQIVTDVAFEWKPVPGATAYNLEADPSIGFSDPLLRATNVHSSRYSYRDSLYNTTYWWRVQAVDPEGNLSPWSQPQKFTRSWLAAPTQVFPADAAAPTSGTDLRFEWTEVDHASRYEIHTSSNEFFSTFSRCLTTATRIYAGTSCNPGFASGEDFFWRVRALDEGAETTILGVWSPTRSHEGHTSRPVVPGAFVPTATPARNLPADCASGCDPLVATPTFSWSGTPGATSYRLFLALDANFTTVVRTYNLGNQTTYTPVEELPDSDAGASYYWYVQPCATPSNCGPSPAASLPPLPSSRFRKTSIRVLLTSPAQGATVANFARFEWEPYGETTAAANADPAPGTTKLEARSYQIQMSRVPTFETLIDDKIVDQPFFTTWDRTYDEGPVYWRVRAIDGSENRLAWSQATVDSLPSEPRTFTKDSPVPIPSAPANGANAPGSATVSWAPIHFANGYEVEVYREVSGQPSFSAANRVFRAVTQQRAASVVQTLPPGTYKWRVRRSDADNRWGAWSNDVYAPTVGGPSFTVPQAAPALLSPADNALTGSNDLSFAWSTVNGAASYRFQRSANTSFTASVQNTTTVMTSYAPPDQWALGTYYWRVQALDSSDQVMGTSGYRRIDKNVLWGVPTGLSASRGDRRANLLWTAPAPPPAPATPGTPITAYVVTPYVNGIAQPVRVLPATPTSGVITELVNGTTYTFRVAARNSGGTGPQSAPSNPVTPSTGPSLPPGSVYVPITPCRVVDTRSGAAGFGRFGPNQIRAYQVAGSSSKFQQQGGKAGGCGIPDGATAVEASVTAVDQSANGYFRAWPTGEAQPNATFLNFTKGQGTTNTGAIKLAPTGIEDLNVVNAGATAHYVIDVQGYYFDSTAGAVGGGTVYVPVTPCRVVDTRGVGRLTPTATRNYQVAGSTAFPAQGGKSGGCGIPLEATAVEASVTSVDQLGNGYFRAWPSGEAMPNATFLNYTKGQGTTNTGAIKVSATNTTDLTVRNFGASSHYVIDVQGYFVDATSLAAVNGSVYVPITPCRVVDTRSKVGPFRPTQTRSYRVAGTSTNIANQGGKVGGCGIPETAGAVEASVTALQQNANGYFRAWPAGETMPNATFLNYTKGLGTTNTGAIKVSTTNTYDLAVQNFSATSDYVIDIQGYFVSGS